MFVFVCLFIVCGGQVSDSSYLQFLGSWPEENKPTVLLFDQMSDIPLLFKVSAGHTHTHSYRSNTNIQTQMCAHIQGMDIVHSTSI